MLTISSLTVSAVSPSAYAHGLGILLLQLFSPLSIRIVISISFLLQLVFLCKTLFGDISVQTRYDICNSTSYAINYYCHSDSFWMSSFCFLDAVGRPHLKSKRSFYFYIIGNRLFLYHSPSEWFSVYKKARPPAWKIRQKPRCDGFCCGLLFGHLR